MTPSIKQTTSQAAQTNNQAQFAPLNSSALASSFTPALIAAKPANEKALTERKSYALPYNGGELNAKMQIFERSSGLFGLFKESYVKCTMRGENGKDVVFETPVDKFPPNNDTLKAIIRTAYKNGNLPSSLYKTPSQVLAARKKPKASITPEKVNGFERNSLFSGVSIISGVSNFFAGAGQWVADNNFLGSKQAGQLVAAQNPEFQKAQAKQGYNPSLAATQFGEGVGEALTSGIVLSLGGEIMGATKIAQWGPKLISSAAAPVVKIGAKVVKPALAPLARALKPAAKLLAKPSVQKVVAKTVKVAPKIALGGIQYGLPAADLIKLGSDIQAKNYKDIGRDIAFLPFTVLPMPHGSSSATTPALKSKTAASSSKLPRKITRVKPSIARRVPLKNPIVRAIAVAPVFASGATTRPSTQQQKLAEDHREVVQAGDGQGRNRIYSKPEPHDDFMEGYAPELPPHVENTKPKNDNIFHSIPSSHIYNPFKDWKTMSAEDRMMTIVKFGGKTEFDHDFLRFFAQKDSLTLADMDMIVEARDYFGAFNRVEKLGNHFNLKQNSAYLKLNQTQQIAVEILELHSDEFALVNIRSAELHILLQDIIKIVKDPQLKKGECAIYAKDIFKVCRSRNMSAAEATLFLQTRLKAIVSLRQKFQITKNDLNIYIPKEQNLHTDIEQLWTHYNGIKTKLVALTPEWRMMHDKWGQSIGDIEANMHVIKVNMSPIARKEIGAKITEIDRIVDADPILNTPRTVNNAKNEIFYFVRNGYSPSDAYRKYGCSNLNWVAQKIGIDASDLVAFEHDMRILSLDGKSRLGKLILTQMPKINELFAADGYYTGIILRDKKMAAFNYMRIDGILAEEAFNRVLSYDTKRVAQEITKRLSSSLNLNLGEERMLERLIYLSKRNSLNLAPRIEKFLLAHQTKNIVPTATTPKIIYTMTYTGDALSEIELVSKAGHDLTALSNFLDSKGF
jgi:hypothetical protein